MSENDGIDEVALNVLLAEGVDFPTAFEASRIRNSDSDGAEGSTPARNPGSSTGAGRVSVAAIIAVVVILAAVLWRFI